jgi:starvation-inducible outer membrane lipoprotein
MKYCLFLTTFLVTGCATLPELYKTVDDIATDDAITVKVDRDAFKKDTDVNVIVEVKNKDPLKTP